MQVSVYRYNPDLDEVPVMQDVQVDLPEGKDLMVLDVLHLMKDEDPTLRKHFTRAQILAIRAFGGEGAS